MSQALIALGLFSAKSIVILTLIFLFIVCLVLVLAKIKGKSKGRLQIKNINKKYTEMIDLMNAELLSKKDYKTFLKKEKQTAKKELTTHKNIFLVNFDGDMKANAVAALSEEITAILMTATVNDEVVIKLESPGGVVHGYGLAAAQLMRIRAKNIPLTITVDKVAASGGYMMASIADKILAAPFAIIGSIGVIVQLPNFHRLLKDKHIDFEQHTAGEFKRTITIFGENTAEGKEKLQEEIESIHEQFKNLISTYRPQLNIDQVATGEHWLGQQALELKLVDEVKTSDEYLLDQIHTARIIEVKFEIKKPMLSRFAASAKSYIMSFLLSNNIAR